MKINISLSAIPLKLAKKNIRAVKSPGMKRYDAIFNKYGSGKRANKDRIYVPLSALSAKPVTADAPPPVEIVEYVNSLGMQLDDYYAGTVLMADGKRTMRLGKVLSKKPELKRLFENDPNRKSATTVKGWVVFSRHPYDILGMSFDRGWTSCMNLDEGSNRHYLKEDVKMGTIVAYMVKDTDRNINNPVARIALRPYFDKSKAHYILVPSEAYGDGSRTFTEIVKKFTHFVNSHAPAGIYKIGKNLYDDGAGEEVFNMRDDTDVRRMTEAQLKLVMRNETMLTPFIQKQIAEWDNQTWAFKLAYNHREVVTPEAQVILARSKHLTVREQIARKVDICDDAFAILAQDPSQTVVSGIANYARDPRRVALLAKSNHGFIRAEAALNDNLPLEDLIALADDPDSDVVYNALSNDRMPPEVLKRFGDSTDKAILEGLTFNDKTDGDTLDRIARLPEITLNVRRNIASNSSVLQKTLELLSNDEEGRVRASVARKIKSKAILTRLADDEDPDVVADVAYRKVPEEILMICAKHASDYNVLYNLIHNKNTTSAVMRIAVNEENELDSHQLVEIAEGKYSTVELVQYILSYQKVRRVAYQLASSRSVKPEILTMLGDTQTDENVLTELAMNKNCPPETVHKIAVKFVQEQSEAIDSVILSDRVTKDTLAYIMAEAEKIGGEYLAYVKKEFSFIR